MRFKSHDPDSLDEAGQKLSRADTNSVYNKREMLKKQRKRRNKMRTGLDRDESIRKEVVGVKHIRAEICLLEFLFFSSLQRLVCCQEDRSQRKLQSPSFVF